MDDKGLLPTARTRRRGDLRFHLALPAGAGGILRDQPDRGQPGDADDPGAPHAALFIGFVFWWYVWGIPGAILAVPMMAAMKIVEGLDEREREVLAHVPLPLDCGRVRRYRPGCGGPAGLARRLVLRLTRGRAIALGNRIFLPASCENDLAVLAHELTHCAQYQAWGPLRYYARGAVTQLRDLAHRIFGLGQSQYAWRPEESKPFEAYGMEQQGQIVEDSMRGHVQARELIGRCARGG